MNESRNGTIDAQIKELLARAIADSPPPPDLAYPMLTTTPDRRTPNRNPWIVLGGVSIAAAATVAGLLIIPGIDDQTTVIAPSNTALPEVTSAVSVLPEVTGPGTVAVEEPTATTSPDGAAPATTTATDGAPTTQRVVVSAGPSGIEVVRLGEVGQVVTTEPAKFAVEGPDGRIYFEPAAPLDAVDADTRPRVLDTATGEVTLLDVPAPADNTVRLLDVADVDGQLTILYSASYDACTSGSDPACLASLRTFQPDTGASQILAERNTWEFGWQPFTLATNGIVAGAGYESVVEEPHFFNVGGGIAPTLAALGLEDGYADCVDCPTAFAVDAEGGHVAWIDGPVGDRRVVVTDLSNGTRAEVAIADFDRPSYLQLAGVEIADGVIVAGQAAFTPFAESGDAAPVLVDLASGATQELTPATIASLS